MTENNSGMGNIKLFITVHAVERYYERAFGFTEEASKELTSEQRYRIVKIIEQELADEHPEAFSLGAGIYKSKDLGVTFVLEHFRVLTITENSKAGDDRRLRGGKINGSTKYSKDIKRNKKEKYRMREGSSDT